MPRIGIAHKATVMMAHMVNSTVPRPPPLGAGATGAGGAPPTSVDGAPAGRLCLSPRSNAAPQPNHHRLWGEHSDQPADGHETAPRAQEAENGTSLSNGTGIPQSAVKYQEMCERQCQSRGGHGGSRHIDDD